jgi:hypothetical protein
VAHFLHLSGIDRPLVDFGDGSDLLFAIGHPGSASILLCLSYRK